MGKISGPALQTEAEVNEDMDSLSSQLQQLRSEVAAEQDVRALEASTAAAAEGALSFRPSRARKSRRLGLPRPIARTRTMLWLLWP